MSEAAAAPRPIRVRVDDLLVQRGDAATITEARALILAGRVHGEGKRYQQAGQQIRSDSSITVRQSRRYVSRGGEKLAAALDSWQIAVQDHICLDVGASTGGFTDALLQRGAARVFAVDVGYGQLDERLRNDSRVVSMERTHINEMPALPKTPTLATVDVSFIGLVQVLQSVADAIAPQSSVVALVKPQFELPESDVDSSGVVSDRRAQARAVSSVLSWAFERGWRCGGVLKSPLAGHSGNREWFVWLQTP